MNASFKRADIFDRIDAVRLGCNGLEEPKPDRTTVAVVEESLMAERQLFGRPQRASARSSQQQLPTPGLQHSQPQQSGWQHDGSQQLSQPQPHPPSSWWP